MAKAYSGLGQETGGANHPGVNDIDAFGKNLGHDGRVKWLMDNVGLSKQEAERGADTIYDYTGSGYDEIHNGTDKEGGDIIDAIIHNPNAPVYTGSQYRGIFVSQDNLDYFTGGGITPREYLENILKTGVWKEPGVSSFSSNIQTAFSFGKFDYQWKTQNDISVLIVYDNGKSGMPIKHMSGLPGENEVLHSGKQMRDGLDIVQYNWVDGGKKFGQQLRMVVTDKPVKRR